MNYRLYRRLGLLMAVGLLCLTVSLAPAPATHAQSGQRCFDETGFCIEGRIREFWEQNGGLPVFGLPITPQQEESIEGVPLQVQWFERNRLELHPQNQPPYDVLLGRLGVDRLTQKGCDWQRFPVTTAQANCRFFPETGHNVCGDILTRWRANGLEIDGVPGTSEAESLALFGLPLTPPHTETINGQQYTVQWFERARFEIHAELAPSETVLLGLLGQEARSVPAGTAPPAMEIAPIQIGELTTYTHPSGAFSIDVPTNWSVEDQSGADVVVTGFLDPTRNGLIVASVFTNPTPMQLVDPTLMGEILRQGIQNGFIDKTDLVINAPEPQADGSVKVSFTMGDAIECQYTIFAGHGYIREDANLISLLFVVAPQDQFGNLEQSFTTIVGSYRVDPSVSVP